MQFEDYASRLKASDFASRSKARAKPQKRDSASSSTRTVPIRERIWTEVERGEYSLSDHLVSKKLINLLRHGSLPRKDDGAIEFWRKTIFRLISCIVIIGLTNSGRKAWQEEETIKKYQYCTGSSGAIVYLRALQGHSGRNIIDPSLQDNVLIPDGFFKYIYHAACAINLHSITNSGLIPEVKF